MNNQLAKKVLAVATIKMIMGLPPLGPPGSVAARLVGSHFNQAQNIEDPIQHQSQGSYGLAAAGFPEARR